MSSPLPMVDLLTKTLVHSTVPDASRTPALSRTKEGLLVTEIDLNLVRQIRDFWMLRMTARLDMYADLLTRASGNDFKPDIVKG